MAAIHSDAEFRAALSGLSVEQQRRVGKRFLDSVSELSDNPKLEKSLAVVEGTQVSAEEIAEACRVAATAARDSYTLCGREADWRRQASHFFAAAAAACLGAADKEGQGEELAWTTAMNARMARVCEKIAQGEGYDNSEVGKQYEILRAFLDAS
jgi:hypothetical protein